MTRKKLQSAVGEWPLKNRGDSDDWQLGKQSVPCRYSSLSPQESLRLSKSFSYIISSPTCNFPSLIYYDSEIFLLCYLLLMFIYFVIIRFKLCVLFFSKSKVNIFIIKFSPGLEFLKIPHLLLTFWKSLGPHTLYDFLDYILVIGFSLYSQLYFLLLFLNSSYHFLIPTPIINFHLFKEIKKILDRFLHVLL